MLTTQLSQIVMKGRLSCISKFEVYNKVMFY